jgi:S-adenosylmethionine synthetase
MKIIITGTPFSLPASPSLAHHSTGASGVLGRAATKHFHSKGDTVLPLSFSRTASHPSLPAYQKLDLLDFDATRDFFRQENDKGKIDVILHCAAERRPDVAEQDPERAERLNKDAVAVIAELAEEIGCLLIYISTDYVFDGKK